MTQCKLQLEPEPAATERRLQGVSVGVMSVSVPVSVLAVTSSASGRPRHGTAAGRSQVGQVVPLVHCKRTKLVSVGRHLYYYIL